MRQALNYSPNYSVRAFQVVYYPYKQSQIQTLRPLFSLRAREVWTGCDSFFIFLLLVLWLKCRLWWRWFMSHGRNGDKWLISGAENGVQLCIVVECETKRHTHSSQNSYWDCYGSSDEQRLFSVKFARFCNFFDVAQIWGILESD